jgi:predicted XRE-type DNA-binding protein
MTRPLGSRLDSWLEDEGLLEPATAKAIKSMLAWRIAQAMKTRGITTARLAHELRTSEAAVDRLLDPSCTTLTLRTLTRTALALGMDLEVRLVDRSSDHAPPTR